MIILFVNLTLCTKNFLVQVKGLDLLQGHENSRLNVNHFSLSAIY